MANETNIKVLKIEVDTGTGAIKVDGVTKSIKEAIAATKEFVGSAGKMKKTTSDLGSAAGLAGATVNELGRLISDMPYGITAVTNNISQLGSMFTALVQKASQVKNGLSTTTNILQLLKDQFLGPVGILILFQGAIALLEKFSQSSKKAATEANKLNQALGSAGGQIAILNTYKDVIEDSTSSTEDQESALKSLKKEGYDPLIGTLEEFLEAKAKILLFDATKSVIEQEISDAITEQRNIEDQIKALDEKIIERTNTLDQLRKGSGAGVGATAIGGLIDKVELQRDLQDLKDAKNSILSTQTSLTDELREKYLKLVRDLEENDFICILFGTCKTNGATKKALKAVKTFELIFTEIEKVNERAKKQYLEKNSFLDYAVGITDRQVKEMKKKAKAALKDLEKISIPPPDNSFKYWAEAKIDSLSDIASGLDAIADLTASVAGIMDAEFQKQMDIEQNKTTGINNELKKRLANEKISADERRSIQSKIAANDEKLRLKQEEIAKKRFKTEKAMRISLTLIDTASSAMRAYSSQLIPADPSSLIRAQVAAALATALGLAQVAMISKQQFVGSASATPPGVGGSLGEGGGVQAPDFNIVGQSASNQIAAAVQGQLSQPIKAFVVSKDVSTAQEMDRNIIGSASLG
jgi:hypothetical protein